MSVLSWIELHIRRLRCAVVCCAWFLASCGSGLTDEEQKVVTWAYKMGLRVDDWQVGEINLDLTYDAWKAEGSALPNAEEILLRLLRRRVPNVEPMLLVSALSAVGTERSLDVLSGYTRDRHLGMRMFALHSLGRIGDPRAFPVVADRFLHDSETNCRVNAVVALERIGDLRAIAMIEETLANTKLMEEALEKVCIGQARAEDEMALGHARFLRRYCEKALGGLRKGHVSTADGSDN